MDFFTLVGINVPEVAAHGLRRIAHATKQLEVALDLFVVAGAWLTELEVDNDNLFAAHHHAVGAAGVELVVLHPENLTLVVEAPAAVVPALYLRMSEGVSHELP